MLEPPTREEIWRKGVTACKCLLLGVKSPCICLRKQEFLSFDAKTCH